MNFTETNNLSLKVLQKKQGHRYKIDKIHRPVVNI